MASDKQISWIIGGGASFLVAAVVGFGIYIVSREGYVSPRDRHEAVTERREDRHEATIERREAAIERLAELEVEKSRAERGYVLQERDLNGNGVPERFFEIEGIRYFLEIDGENLYDTLIKK
ncbi:MAG: hypothetical protein IIA87_05595 [Nanoarchaeota archaeon]|nr:hypothetical protein [Nanoarchaeota archaeon]